jgi:hypothetical protein
LSLPGVKRRPAEQAAFPFYKMISKYEEGINQSRLIRDSNRKMDSIEKKQILFAPNRSQNTIYEFIQHSLVAFLHTQKYLTVTQSTVYSIQSAGYLNLACENG